MKLIHVSLGSVAAGVLLVVLSFLLPSLVGGKRAWSDEQAKVYSEATSKMHQLGHERNPDAHAREHGNATHAKERDAKQLAAEYEKARERVEQLNVELERARTRGQTTAAWLQWIGVVCVVGGGAGYYVLRNADTR